MANFERLHKQFQTLEKLTRGTFTDKFYECLKPVDLVYQNRRSFRAIYKLKADRSFINAYGVFHSGAFATIIDLTVIGACRCNNKHTDRIVTAHLDMDLLKVVKPEEEIRVEAVIYKTGKYLNFGNALFINEKEELVAKGSAVGSCVYTKEYEAKFKTTEPEV